MQNMAPRRHPPAVFPSPAQAAAILQFEAAYYGGRDDTSQETLVRDIEAAKKKDPDLVRGKRRTFSTSTYHSWRRQASSPTIHDLELLSRVAGRCLTLLVEGSSSSKGESMSERLEEVIAALRALPVESQLVLAGKIEEQLEKERARHPHVADAHPAARARK